MLGRSTKDVRFNDAYDSSSARPERPNGILRHQGTPPSNPTAGHHFDSMLNNAPNIVKDWHRCSGNDTGDVILGMQTLDIHQVEKLGVPADYSYQVIEGHYYLITNGSSYPAHQTTRQILHPSAARVVDPGSQTH